MPRPTTPSSLSVPKGSLVILPETISPLSVSNIEDTHTNLIRTTFPLLLPSTPILGLSISPFFWVFYHFFLSLSNRPQFIRKWNFPFFKYFIGIVESGNSFILQNNLGVFTSPSGGNGNIDPFFEILDRIPNEEDFIPDFDENDWLDIPEDNRSIEMRAIPIPMPELRNVRLDNIRQPPVISIASRMLNKIIYLTGFSNTTTPDDHGTESKAIINVVQASPLPSIKLIRTDNFPETTGGGFNTNFYLAFAEAMKFATEGDVILVNQSISAKKGLVTYEVPLIFDKLLWDLIRFLSDNGITIVLSAGNSPTNLNRVATGVFAFAKNDSGAIIVGQYPETVGSTGSLVDVRCENLPVELRPNRQGESSAASAIVAGMVKNMQSYAISRGRYLSALQVKGILKNIPQPLEFNRTILSQDGIGDIIKNEINVLIP